MIQSRLGGSFISSISRQLPFSLIRHARVYSLIPLQARLHYGLHMAARPDRAAALNRLAGPSDGSQI